MVPSIIAPHPFLNRAIVVFQSINTVPNFELTKNTRFAEFIKDLQGKTSDSYPHLCEFFGKCADKGLDFLGYFLDEDLKYHFIFYERDQSKSGKSIHLQFDTLEELSYEDIEHTVKLVNSHGAKFKTIVTLIGGYG